MNFNKYNDNFNIIGENLRKLRKAKKYSQDKLSNKLSLMGITLYQSDIFKIEHNQRTIRDYEIWGICQILEISYEELFLDVLDIDNNNIA